MPDQSFLSWPFFEARHRELARASSRLGCRSSSRTVDHDDVDAACRDLVARARPRRLARGTARRRTSATRALDVRTLALIRETLARHAGLADFAFAMQGLGAGPISLFGSAEQRAAWLPQTRAGKAIAAFALTEPESGSDVANIATTAPPRRRRLGARRREDLDLQRRHRRRLRRVRAHRRSARRRGLSAFIVRGDNPGLTIAERIEVIAPHPLARLRFDGLPRCRRRADRRAGRRLQDRDGDARRVPHHGRRRGARLCPPRARRDASSAPRTRELFGAPLAELQMVQGHIADMALEVDAAALLVYRAAWTKDTGAARVTREAAMAKLYATEAAQRVIDTAVQLHGGDGVRSGHPVETLYREIRALRIYEGASDVQKVVIARAVLAGDGGSDMSDNAVRLGPSAHVDTFTRDNLPPSDQWPEICCSTGRNSSIPSTSMPASS